MKTVANILCTWGLCLIIVGMASVGIQAQNLTVEGNVGIGTTNPTEKLDVNGNLSVDSVTADGNINLKNGTDKTIGIPADNDGQFTGGLRDLTVRAGGRISSSNSTSVGGNLILKAGNANIGVNPVSKSNNVMIYAGDNVFTGTNGNIYNGDILFFAGNNLPERMRIVGDNGNVGIGTTSPAAKLDVNGNMRVDGFLYIDHEDTPAFFGMAGVDLGSNGVLIENSISESAGFHADADRFTIWSPGDNDRLLRVFDEDFGPNGERWFVDGDGDDMKASDADLKKDIKTLERSLEKVQQLRGVSFTWKKNSEELAKGDKETSSIGVIAQELEQVFPELVTTNEQGRKFVDYKGLTPILIEAVKEQQLEIEDKNEKIEWLLAENDAIKARLAKIEALLEKLSIDNSVIKNSTSDYRPSTSTTVLTDAKLEQNQPNPFNGSTVVRYFIPEGVKRAELRITDLTGKVIKSVAIQARGEGQTTFDATTLSSGNYQYSLFLDGQLLDTKQMVLTKN